MKHDGFPCSGVLLIEKGKILLVRHGETASHLPGTYGLPSGRPESDETSIQTALREFHEETGLETSLEFLKPYPGNIYTAEFDRQDEERKKFTMTVFICTKYWGDLVGNSSTVPYWVEVKKMGDLNLLANTQKMVTDAKPFI